MQPDRPGDCSRGFADVQHPDLCDCGELEPPHPRLRPPPTRYYGPHNLGGLCEACGEAIPASLAGTTRHPSCDPDMPPMLAAFKRALARRKEPHR